MNQDRIGILALQGAFEKHARMVERLGACSLGVRNPSDLALCDALIIPGGESTTLFSRMEFIGLHGPLREFALHKPVFGTCAGLIVMAKAFSGGGGFSPFGWLDVEVDRNGYGRQVESFITQLDTHGPLDGVGPLKGVFIRAPRIKQCGSDVQVLATCAGEPVIVQKGRFLGAACHPELTDDLAVHRHFLSLDRVRSGS